MASKRLISLRYSRRKKKILAASEMHSAIGKAHHTALTVPVSLASSHAAGTNTINCRMREMMRL